MRRDELQQLVAIGAAIDILTFQNAPNFEAPADTGRNNVYDVQVTVTDGGGLTGVQNLAVTVSDVDDVAPTVALTSTAMAPVGGLFTVDIAANVATDGAGNGNAAATQFAIAADLTAPTVEILGAPRSIGGRTTFAVTIRFSEPVTGFEADDIAVASGN